MTQRPLALVTGASSGIGRAIAEVLAARNYDLVLVARREAALMDLASQLSNAHGISCEVRLANLALRDDRERLVAEVQAEQQRLEVLVNNAGFGTHGFFRETDLERELELIEVNCAAPVHLTKRILPWMLERRRGYVLNVASVASFTPGPVMNLYYSSKAFVRFFSEALWEECRGTGVVVTALCPGPVKTEFQRVAGLAATARTSGAAPMSAHDVAVAGVQGMLRGEREVVPGRANRWITIAARLFPTEFMLKRVRRIQEERRRQTIEAMRREQGKGEEEQRTE